MGPGRGLATQRRRFLGEARAGPLSLLFAVRVGNFNSVIGRVISQYRIVEKLRQGAMGVVYRAEDLKLNRQVAVKMLPPDVGHDEEQKKRFLQEARAASAIDHVNIGS